MRGVAVIGSSAGGDEPAVAAAVCRALRAAGEAPAAVWLPATGRDAQAAVAALALAAAADSGDVAPLVLEQDATPCVAARHAGAAVDPERLVAHARSAADAASAAVVATSGGLLAPLTPHFTTRDLALELGLPVVVAAPAGANIVNHALLTAEALAGAGLAVVAVVVTGWPPQPPRVLLDERDLLSERAPAPILTLDAQPGDAPPRWPVTSWLDAGGRAAPADTRVTLEPYRAWEPRPVGDPRSAPRAEIMGTLLSIVEAEGPMRASRAYALYNRAAGGHKLTSVARAPLSSALYWLAREQAVALTRADDIPWQGDDLVRMPDSPPVRVRELGGRTLEDVPLDELAELLRRISRATGTREATALKRAALAAYGLVRLTTRADEYLGLALDLAEL